MAPGGGLGSFIYALLCGARLLDAPALLEDAIRAASLITSDRINADRALDVVSGAAGAVLAILSLYGETGEARLLETAVLAGHHLMEKRSASAVGPRAWKSSSGAQLAGFAHGASGIALALARLYAVTGERAFLDAAEDGFAYERGIFVPDAKNWPDLRSRASEHGEPACMTAWCHGATGIGLARLAVLAVLDTPEIRQDLETALQTTAAHGPEGLDGLCCGEMGRVELLLSAGLQLARPDLVREARHLMQAIVRRAAQRDTYRLLHGLPAGSFHPGPFQGTAGIGHQLLRLARPDLRPSVLLHE
ncbi:MAG: lanthionine synthetase LanC family protein [Dehalococcoidia bacterium]